MELLRLRIREMGASYCEKLKPPRKAGAVTRIHTGFHRFTEIGEIFYKKYFFLENGLDNSFSISGH